MRQMATENDCSVCADTATGSWLLVFDDTTVGVNLCQECHDEFSDVDWIDVRDV